MACCYIEVPLPKDCKEEIRSKIVKIEYFFNDHWFQQAEKMTKYKPLLTIMSITIYVHTDSPCQCLDREVQISTSQKVSSKVKGYKEATHSSSN